MTMRSRRDWIIAVVIALAVSWLAMAAHSALTGEPVRVMMVLGWTPFWMVIHFASVRQSDYHRCAGWLRGFGRSRRAAETRGRP
jgi:hypothetical protein